MRRAALALAAVALLLGGCTSIVQAPPPQQAPVVIDICNTTVCGLPWHPRPFPPGWEYGRKRGWNR